MRAPTTPKGTAHIATSTISPGGQPRLVARRSEIQIARTIPAMMQSAYARTGKGPRYQIPCAGLGMAKTGIRASLRRMETSAKHRPSTCPLKDGDDHQGEHNSDGVEGNDTAPRRPAHRPVCGRFGGSRIWGWHAAPPVGESGTPTMSYSRCSHPRLPQQDRAVVHHQRAERWSERDEHRQNHRCCEATDHTIPLTRRNWGRGCKKPLDPQQRRPP